MPGYHGSGEYHGGGDHGDGHRRNKNNNDNNNNTTNNYNGTVNGWGPGWGYGAADDALAGMAMGTMMGAAMAQPTTVVVQQPATTVIQQVSPAAPPIGSQVTVLPGVCSAENVQGIMAYQCGSSWYRPFFGANGVYYQVVSPPPIPVNNGTVVQ